MTTKRFLASAIFMGVFSGMLLAQAKNPLVGTWTLDVAKSKAPFKSGTTVLEEAGKGLKFVVDLEGTDGKKHHWEFTANYDGKGVPITGESPYGDTVVLERVNARTIRTISKMGGKVMTTHTIVVSADGKTRTATAKGTDKAGKPVDSVSYYVKQ